MSKSHTVNSKPVAPIISNKHDSIDSAINTLDLNTAREIKKKLSTHIKKERIKRGLRLIYVVPERHIPIFIDARDWVFNHGMIERNTNWAFIKFCVMNTIKLVIVEIEKERSLFDRGATLTRTIDSTTDTEE